MTLIKNFRAMPKMLKWLTAISLGAFAIAVRTFFPPGVGVFGQLVSIQDWWMSGAGEISLVCLVVLGASGILMLRRSSHGRLVFILGWIALDLVVIPITGLTQAPSPPILLLAINCMLVVPAAIYLYWNKSVREYFLAGKEQNNRGQQLS